jgi:hypothetical protein
MEPIFISQLRNKYNSIKEASYELKRQQDQWYELVKGCVHSIEGAISHRIVCSHKLTLHPYCGPTVCILLVQSQLKDIPNG